MNSQHIICDGLDLKDRASSGYTGPPHKYLVHDISRNKTFNIYVD